MDTGPTQQTSRWAKLGNWHWGEHPKALLMSLLPSEGEQCLDVGDSLCATSQTGTLMMCITGKPHHWPPLKYFHQGSVKPDLEHLEHLSHDKELVGLVPQTWAAVSVLLWKMFEWDFSGREEGVTTSEMFLQFLSSDFKDYLLRDDSHNINVQTSNRRTVENGLKWMHHQVGGALKKNSGS